jgi:hypothetical protein
MNNIVFEYDFATRKYCDRGLILLWRPDKLINCEMQYRLSMSNDMTNKETYDIFSKEISAPFRRKALNLMSTVQVRMFYITHS